MKKEIDFSQGTRGRFYRKGAEIQVPVYLERSTQDALERVARRKKSDVSALVNRLLKADLEVLREAL